MVFTCEFVGKLSRNIGPFGEVTEVVPASPKTINFHDRTIINGTPLQSVLLFEPGRLGYRISSNLANKRSDYMEP